MKSKPISLNTHCLVDYALVGCLFVLPTVLRLPRAVRKVYAVEALTLFGYVAVTDHPAAIEPLIPIKVHRKVDPVNVAGFVLQTFSKAFRRSKKATIFNIAFTAAAALNVLLTNWEESEADRH